MFALDLEGLFQLKRFNDSKCESQGEDAHLKIHPTMEMKTEHFMSVNSCFCCCSFVSFCPPHKQTNKQKANSILKGIRHS